MGVTAKRPAATWRPGDPIPPLAVAEDCAAILNHTFGVALAPRSYEVTCRLPIVRSQGDGRRYIAMADTLALFAKLVADDLTPWDAQRQGSGKRRPSQSETLIGPDAYLPEFHAGIYLRRALDTPERRVNVDLSRFRRSGRAPPHCLLDGRIHYRVGDLDAWRASHRFQEARHE